MLFKLRMPRVDAVDIFLQMSGSTDKKRLLRLTYAEFAVTVYLLASTYAEILNARNELSIRMFTLILLLIQTYMCLSIAFRVYHQRHFREMHAYADGVRIPAAYRRRIALITNYHMVGSLLFVMFPALYTLAAGSVRAGDHFTFPFLDVAPPDSRAPAVYACKYLFYCLPVYIVHLELCFINTTFIYYVGVLKARCELIVATIDDAVAGGDERKLRTAVVHHQQLLRYFETMKHVFAKPIVLSIVFNGIYFGMSTYFVIQAIQGIINNILLILCIASSIAALINIVVYTFYGSELSVFHDDLLHALFDNPLMLASKTFKRFSIIMMSRTKLPLQFTVCYIITVDLNLLVKIIKISYSVLNVLLSSPVKAV